MNPLITALRQLGGSGSIDEIYEKVIEIEQIPEDVLEKLHDPDKSNLTEVGYRLAWARTYLKKYGVLDNSKRGVWSLTTKGRDTKKIDPQEVVRHVRALDKEGTKRKKPSKPLEDDVPEEEEWRVQLHNILTKEIDPGTFERLIQRMLRESGFVSVEVSGDANKSDGGIDGKGIVRIQGFMSFHVIFQCKRYQGSVSAGAIRDFRGAMVGRADKGLFITTGTFTPLAMKEATRDGAPPIDLVDGDQLADKLKELGLGVSCEMVEKVSVDSEWFNSL